MHFIAELAAANWEGDISLSQVNDQSGSQRENQRAISQLAEQAVETQHKYLNGQRKMQFCSADKLLSDANQGNERRDLWVNINICSPKMWKLTGRGNTDHHRAMGSDWLSPRELHTMPHTAAQNGWEIKSSNLPTIGRDSSQLHLVAQGLSHELNAFWLSSSIAFRKTFTWI